MGTLRVKLLGEQMATQNQVNIGINVSDKGSTAKTTKNVEKLHGILKQTQETASNINVGGTSGSRVAAARAAPRGSEMLLSGEEYGRARGAAGATGAGARDFANQAQGLGGLVRLYATYAANLFAVSAGFNALRNAMDTTNMVEGLNQLGAASGTALGGLAKRFAEASGGAISLRESMEATVKGISSGLTREQLLRLGEVAKKASQALGVNMSDAVSRLSRGITKLEPELLDELGLFTKVGKSSEDYARSIGKTASALTDFEKRQAFANAVLEEGQKKFSEIAIDTNPYDKLLASLKNTAQSILSVVNTVIAPVAGALANNTGLITAAIGLLSIKIVQQALPALASWQKGIAAAAATSANKLNELVDPEGFVERAQAKYNIPKLKAELAQAEAAYASAANSFVKTENNYKSKSSPLLKTLAQGETLQGNNYVNAVKQAQKSTDDLTAAQARHVKGLQQVVQTSDAVVAARKRLASAFEQVQEETDRPLSLRERAQASQYRRASATTARLDILAQVAEDYDTQGFRASVEKAYRAAGESGKINKFGQVLTGVQAAAISGAKALALYGSQLLRLLPILGLAYTAYEVLNSIFSKNSKETAVFRDSLVQLSEVAKTNADVFQKFGNSITVESLNAKATAIQDLADSIRKSTRELSAVDEASGAFDRFIDGFLVPIGKDLKSSYSKNLAIALVEGIKNIPDQGIRSALEAKLKLETGVTNLNVKELKKSLDNIDKDEIVQKGVALSQLVDNANKGLQSSRALSQQVEASAKSAASAELDLRNSLSKSDSLGVFYSKIIAQLQDTKKALEDSVSAAAEFDAIAKGTRNLNFIDSANLSKLKDVSTEYSKLSRTISNTESSIQSNREKLANIQTQLQSRLLYNTARAELNRESSRLRGQIESQSGQLANIRRNLNALANEAQTILQAAYTRAFDAAIVASGRKLQISNLEAQKSAIGFSGVQTTESLRAQLEIDKKILKLKELEITSQYDLIDALDRNAAELKILDLEKQLQGASRDPQFRQQLQDQLAIEQAKLGLIGGRPTKEQLALLRTGGGASGLELIQRRSARNLAVAETANAVRGLELGFNRATTELAFKDLEQSLSRQKVLSEQQLKSLQQTEEYLAAPASRRAELERPFLEQQARLDETIKGLPNALAVALANISGLPSQREKATTTAEQQLGISASTLRIAGDERERKESSLKLIEALTKADRLNTDYYNTQREGLQVTQLDLNYRQQSLQKDLERNNINQDTFNARKDALALEEAGLTRALAILDEEEKRTKTLLEIRKKIAEEGNIASPENLSAIEAANKAFESGVRAINNQYEATKRLIDLNKELADRQQAYSSIFEKTFAGMADALVEFAQTGKLNFKELINSMIADLVRYELKLQMMDAYAAARPGIMNFIGSLFGGWQTGLQPSGAVVGGPMSTGSSMVATSIGPLSAKGNVFDSAGLQKFAKGGTFTNSIVNAPTLFKFAKGTGLMGEAGPEAIMPLSRDSQGNLGIVAKNAQPKVDVIVNNYSNAQATTKETVDGKGNRKIEVVIGEIVAGEMGRTGSSLQQSMISNFSTKPTTARR